MKTRKIGDGWYEVTGHPTISAGARKHSKGHWGYYFRNVADNSPALDMQYGEEHPAATKAEAIQKIKEVLTRAEKDHDT